MPQEAGEENPSDETVLVSASVLDVRLRLLRPAFFPQEHQVSVSVLRGDGSLATCVSVFPAEVDVQAYPDSIIPLQVFAGTGTSCSTLFLPLAEITKNCSLPTFCTLWLGVPTSTLPGGTLWLGIPGVTQPCNGKAGKADNYAMKQHFDTIMELGKDLTHPKVGLGVRISQAAGSTDSTQKWTEPIDYAGLFRVVDMYEDLLAAMYMKAHDHIETRVEAGIRAGGAAEQEPSAPSVEPKLLEHSSNRAAADANIAGKKIERLRRELTQKQRQISQLQSEVHGLKLSRKPQISKSSSPTRAGKPGFGKASARDAVYECDFSIGTTEPATGSTTDIHEVGEAPLATAFSALVADAPDEVAELRLQCHSLHLELQRAREEAKMQMDSQTQRAIQSMRAIQTKATEYEEEMQRKSSQILELKKELQLANQESITLRELVHKQESANLQTKKELHLAYQEFPFLRELVARQEKGASRESFQSPKQKQPTNQQPRPKSGTARSSAAAGVATRRKSSPPRNPHVISQSAKISPCSQTALAAAQVGGPALAMDAASTSEVSPRSEWERQALDGYAVRHGIVPPPEGYSI